MRKLLAVLVLALALGGCAGQKSILIGGTSFTASITNPVTKEMLYDVENGLTVAVSGLLTYKRLCIQGALPSSCRAAVVKLQGYTRQARPILRELRIFVRNNDQVNAIGAYNTVKELLRQFNAVATGV